MALCGLVGRFTYGNLQKDSLMDWLDKAWKPLLGYVPELFHLTKGWLGFLCKSPEDVALLLTKKWINGGSSLMVKRWCVAFDPDTNISPRDISGFFCQGYHGSSGTKVHYRP
jgi:hypothetical protein